MRAERLFSALSDLKTDKGNSLTAISVACTLQTRLVVKQLGEVLSSLAVDSEMTKLLLFKASVTAEEAVAILYRPPI